MISDMLLGSHAVFRLLYSIEVGIFGCSEYRHKNKNLWKCL